MFKGYQNEKTMFVWDDKLPPCIHFDKIEEDTEHSVGDYIHYKGEFVLKSEVPIPTNAEQKQKRALAYATEVDPITAHIQRLRDEAEPDEEKITALINERAEKVRNIKELYTYTEN